MVMNPDAAPSSPSAPPPPSRDLGKLDTSNWPTREAPAKLPSSVDVPIVVRRSVLDAVRAHGEGTADIEICGVLVGGAYAAVGPDGTRRPFLHVVGAIRGEHAGSQVAQVTFTAETWNHIHTVLDREWADERIIGWYHTHPNFGIFLSDMDLFIHESFFGAADQLAYVYDPIRQEAGMFSWRGGQAVPTDFLVEDDIRVTATAGGATPGLSLRDREVDDILEETALLRKYEELRRSHRLSIALNVLLSIAVLALCGLLVLEKIAPPPKPEGRRPRALSAEPPSEPKADAETREKSR